MKRLITALLILFSPLTQAEWKFIEESDDGMKIFMDFKTIQRNENTIRIWLKAEFKSSPSKPAYLSSRSLVEYECREKKFRSLTWTNFSDNQLQGKVVDKDTPSNPAWVYAPPESIGLTLLQRACRQK
jgi:hypothetical protein